MRTVAMPLSVGIGLAVCGSPVLADAVYCEDLLRVTDVAMTRQKFALIAGQAREGSFLDTTLPLPGWNDCSLYETSTYTCDSRRFAAAAEAENALVEIVDDVKGCLGKEWTDDKSRSSPVYVVLQNAQGSLGMTLGTDVTDRQEHVIHLVLFVRGR
jgi:hypothetical protein